MSQSAPPEWEKGGLSSAARLHRRLIAALDAAEIALEHCRHERVPMDRLAESLNELRRHALAVDEHLIVASRLPMAKRQRALLPIRGEVDEVELLSHRIGSSALEARGFSARADGLREIGERLDLLDDARRPAPTAADNEGEAWHHRLRRARR